MEMSPVLPVEIRGTLRSVIITNVCAAVGGALLLVLFIALLAGVPLALFPFFFACLVLYLVADTVNWIVRGIVLIRLDGEWLDIYRGASPSQTRIPVGQITDVHLHRRFGRQSLQILLGGEVVRLPGVTLYPGRKIWVTDDAFDGKEFGRFAAAALAYRKRPQPEASAGGATA